jgi:hypothetical protein
METRDTDVEKFIFVFSVFQKGGNVRVCGLTLIVDGCLSKYSVYSPELSYVSSV